MLNKIYNEFSKSNRLPKFEIGDSRFMNLYKSNSLICKKFKDLWTISVHNK